MINIAIPFRNSLRVHIDWYGRMPIIRQYGQCLHLESIIVMLLYRVIIVTLVIILVILRLLLLMIPLQPTRRTAILEYLRSLSMVLKLTEPT